MSLVEIHYVFEIRQKINRPRFQFLMVDMQDELSESGRFKAYFV